MAKSKKIKLNGEQVEIKKIPIGKFSELMLAIDNLPSLVSEAISFEELENLNNEILLTKLPTLLAKAQDDIFKLVSVASGVENIEELDFEEFFDVVTTVIELNNIQAIVSKVKNLGKVLKAKVN
ncbi:MULTISPECIES: hypothetical protein [Virgibacillus]|uniref:Phage tail assembly protein n=1 Tax=Virgibacillus halodenitrificans TaxID=1482 RepID=A0ABR7VLE7_VIRHA|nr:MULTISPECIES: hypothetical protein [Virgibacillus]AIF45434.1 hypothetical protein X953_10175 [Virgibacillus sp. SK37]MBD1222747.1 hypothetical protein [Virgibacillus halodenitrificans]